MCVCYWYRCVYRYWTSALEDTRYIPLEHLVSFIYRFKVQWIWREILKQWWLTIPPISTKQTITSHLETLNTRTIMMAWEWKSRSWLGTGTKMWQGLWIRWFLVYLRNKSWKSECVLSFNMGCRILVFYPKPEASDKID